MNEMMNDNACVGGLEKQESARTILGNMDAILKDLENEHIVLCGGNGILFDGGDYWYVICLVCGATVYSSESRTEVIDSWNRRVSDDENRSN